MENINFREFFSLTDAEPTYQYSDAEIANLYFHNNGMKVRELAQMTGKSVGEMYRILHRHGQPNRRITNHNNVLAFADANLPVSKIADLTGYTSRHVRNILNNKLSD